MKIQLYADENELITPIKVADALIECKCFRRRELQEIAEHLNVYCKAKIGDEITKAYQVSEAELKGTEE